MPGRSSAPSTASAANPTPPAAPAPGAAPAGRAPSGRATTSAQCASAGPGARRRPARALLRAVDGRGARAARAAGCRRRWRRRSARRRDAGAARAGRGVASSASARAARRELAPVGVEQPRAERLHHAGAAVGARRCRRCPSTISVQPWSRAARITSPSADGASRASGVEPVPGQQVQPGRRRPARPPPRRLRARTPSSTGSPGRSRTPRTGTRVEAGAPRRRRACRRRRRRPARTTTSTSGRAAQMPAPGRAATSAAVSDPLNLSGATARRGMAGSSESVEERVERRSARRAPDVASSSNSVTLSSSVPIEMLVTRSRITSTTTGTRNSAISFFACSKAGQDLVGLDRPGSPCSPGLRRP